jgi:hypothetical protein
LNQGQWLCLSTSALQSSTPIPQCLVLPQDAEHSLPFSLQLAAPSTRQLLCLASGNKLLYVLSASLPVSQLSLYSYAVSSDAAFFPITSCLIQSFLKAPFQATRLPWCPSAVPLLCPASHPSSSPTLHSESHNAHFHIKSHPLYLHHKSFLKADKISSTSDK